MQPEKYIDGKLPLQACADLQLKCIRGHYTTAVGLKTTRKQQRQIAKMTKSGAKNNLSEVVVYGDHYTSSHNSGNKTRKFEKEKKS
jgi:hypothetical protein